MHFSASNFAKLIFKASSGADQLPSAIWMYGNCYNLLNASAYCCPIAGHGLTAEAFDVGYARIGFVYPLLAFSIASYARE